MKRIMTLAALLLAAASCQKEDFTKQEDYANKNEGLVFYATLDNTQTKTTITDEATAGYKISWEATDEISVNGVRFVVDVIDPNNHSNATFKKADDETKPDPTTPFKAYYPASIYDGETATLPSTQSYNKDGNIADILPMYTESGDKNFKFTNLCGLMKFTLKGTEKVQSIILKDGSKALSGKFTVSDKAAVLDPSAKGGVKLDCGSEGVQLDETGKTFYVAVPAGTYDDLHLELNTLGYARYAKKTASATATVERNKVYPFEMTPAFKHDYFYFEAVEEGATIGMSKSGQAPDVNLSYSSDGESWNTFIVGTTLITLDKAGDRVYFKGENSTFALNSSSKYNYFTADKKVNVGGNIMYLLDPETPGTSMSGKKFCFVYLFNKMDNLISASDLKLPATKLDNFCYFTMFKGCSALTVAPELPATTLAESCYSYMFSGCSALKVAPELPASTLVKGCYSSMFSVCSALTVAPKLPTTLAMGCYSSMFSGCSALTVAPELSATTLAADCYSSMFKDCSALTAAPELPATTLTAGCYCSMFEGCSALKVAPKLQSTTLNKFCYSSMFSGCSALTVAPELSATTLTESCYSYMFKDCSALTAAPELPATTLTASCYSFMFENCSALETAPELPATNLANSCYSNMFKNCTALKVAPDLLATTLVDECYIEMFNGCEQLCYVKCLGNPDYEEEKTRDWLNGVAQSGTFVRKTYSGWSEGESGIPHDWTVEEVE